MSLKAAVIFAILAVASAGLVHPKTKSAAAFESRKIEAQPTREGAGKALGAPAKTVNSVSYDPTLLALEQSLISDYCTRPTVAAFSKVCRGLNEPTVYTMCTDLSSSREKGTLAMKAQTAVQKCAFFITAPDMLIDVKCKVVDTTSPSLTGITVDEADSINGGSEKHVEISSGSPSALGLKNAVRVIFETTDKANFECTWSTKPATA